MFLSFRQSDGLANSIPESAGGYVAGQGGRMKTWLLGGKNKLELGVVLFFSLE